MPLRQESKTEIRNLPFLTILFTLENNLFMVNTAVFRNLALQLKDCTESPHFEKTSFRVKNRIFATLDEKTKRAVLTLNAIHPSVFVNFDTSKIYPVPGAWGKQGWNVFEITKIRKNLLEDVLVMAHSSLFPKK